LDPSRTAARAEASELLTSLIGGGSV
jgi:hypothetical protein